MKVYIESYGCTFNKADGQIIAGVLNENNIDIVDSIEKADVIIVNTCYVKLPTENKVVYKIQKLQEDYPDKKIIVGGCMVEIDPETSPWISLMTALLAAKANFDKCTESVRI